MLAELFQQKCFHRTTIYTTNKKCTDMNIQYNKDTGSVYTCPMHPDVSEKKRDKCPICGMDLVAFKKNETAEFEVKISSVPEFIEACKPAIFSFSITKNGENAQLDIAHEMKIHLLLVNEELTWFDHIHPAGQPDGTYTVTETFPGGGKFLLFTDYKPTGASQRFYKQEIEVKGAPLPNKEEVVTKFVSTVDGYIVTLWNGHDIKINKSQALQFSVEKGGKELQENEIQNYLGAKAHIVVISKSDKNFLHIHSVYNSRFPIYAETHINKIGIYRMWVQFQIDEKVHTADFTVNVAEGEKTETGHGHPTHDH